MNSGLVIKNTGNQYQVEDNQSGETAVCRLKGNFRLKNIRTTNPVTVGDIVDYETDDKGNSVITNIRERRNYIIRKASNLSRESHIIAANIDMAFVVVTLDHPVTNREFIDRFLVTAEAYHVPATIILNKTDLYTEEYAPLLEDFRQTYKIAGYRVIEVSAANNVNIDILRELIKGKTTLFSGNSGVGKSTLIQTIDPSLNLRTGEISTHHNRGKHTTTFSEMFKLSEGGYLIDTPGIKGFGLIDFEKEEICRYFPEIFRYAPECQYYNCTHTHEPDCAVKDAVGLGYIGESRYISYLKLLEGETTDSKYRK